MKIRKFNFKNWIAIVVLSFFCITLCGCDDPIIVDPSDEMRRFMISHEETIIIDELYVFVGDGKEIESMRLDAKKNNKHKKELEDPSISLKIPNDYENITEFTIVVKDLYGLKYEQKVIDVPVEGEFQIKITEGDYVKQPGDALKLLEKELNK